MIKIAIIDKMKVMLGAVMLLALLLRVVELDKFPAGFNADEAAIGYNAYSILKTLKDEYGEILPLNFKSFGDYKPGLYFYFALPFVATIGLNEWAVRLPSAFLGTSLVLLIYFLAKEIFKDRKSAVFCALFLAINPWSIHFSRGGWESNAATFFLTLGVFLLVKTLAGRSYLFWSLLSFLVSMYLYQSPRLVVPVFILFLTLIYRKELLGIMRKRMRYLVVSTVIIILLSIPVILQFVSGQGSARFAGLSSFADPGPANRVNELRGEHESPNGLAAKTFHNKITAYFPNFLGHYFDHFSADFLFINGDPLIRNKIPETGQFYLIQSLFLIAGIFFLVKFDSKLKYLLFFWVITAPLASAMTYQTPHAVRALSMVVPLTMIMGFGFINIIKSIARRKVKLLTGILLLFVLGFEFSHYLESYYIHAPKRYPLAHEFGFSEMVNKLRRYESDFNKVIITDRYDQPYILVLFYKKYDPLKYQPQALLSERDKFNFGTVRSFDKYEFHKITREEVSSKQNTLFIATPEETGDNFNIIDSVRFPNGEIAFLFIRT